MEEIYGARPVQVPAAGLWTMPPALGFAITQMIRAGLLDADLDAIGGETAARRLELGKSKSASKGTGGRGSLLPTATIVPARP